jgi:predicted metal-dependent hydrolase
MAQTQITPDMTVNELLAARPEAGSRDSWIWSRSATPERLTQRSVADVRSWITTMAIQKTTIEIHEVTVEVIRKSVKHMRLTVVPPDGLVRVSVPRRVNDSAVRTAVTIKLDWIRQKQRLVVERAQREARFRSQVATGETHWSWGRPYRLSVVEGSHRPSVSLRDDDQMVMHVPAGASAERRLRVLDRWYRTSLASRIPGLIESWEPIIGEEIAEWRIKKMKTRWGSCNPRARRVWLGLELAKRLPECTEYVLVHEMVHLIEPSHNRRFYALMDRFMPDWRDWRNELNRGGSETPCP